VATEAQAAESAKLLVVEDDEMIRMLIAEMLSDIGYTVAAEAATVDEALEATRKTEFDLAILDADLKGRSVSPVADALAARDTRFVFVTGGGDHGLLAYRDRPTLNKPFKMETLKRCCKSALERGSLPRR
jgi:DNA-binding response OmpR family regulator